MPISRMTKVISSVSDLLTVATTGPESDLGAVIGISSRGLGSTRQEAGKTIVQEDFQLVCFDLVSEPSTTGAFMLREGKEPNIFTKADKINRLLNDLVKE